MQSKTRNSFLTSHWQAGVQLSPGKQDPVMSNSDLGKASTVTPNVLPSSYFPQLYKLSTRPYGMEYPWGQLGSAVLAVPSPSPSLLELCVEQERPWLWAKGKTPLGYRHVPSSNRNLSPGPATVKKINSHPKQHTHPFSFPLLSEYSLSHLQQFRRVLSFLGVDTLFFIFVPRSKDLGICLFPGSAQCSWRGKNASLSYYPGVSYF